MTEHVCPGEKCPHAVRMSNMFSNLHVLVCRNECGHHVTNCGHPLSPCYDCGPVDGDDYFCDIDGDSLFEGGRCGYYIFWLKAMHYHKEKEGKI